MQRNLSGAHLRWLRADPARANASEHVAEDANQKHRKQSIKTICDTRKAKLKEKTGCARSKERVLRKLKDMCYICQLQTIFTSEKRARSCTDPSTSSGAALTESSAGTTPFLQRFRGWRDDAWRSQSNHAINARRNEICAFWWVVRAKSKKLIKAGHSTAQQCIATKSALKQSKATCKSKAKNQTTKQRGANQKTKQTEATHSKAKAGKSTANAIRRRKGTSKPKRTDGKHGITQHVKKQQKGSDYKMHHSIAYRSTAYQGSRPR